MRVTKKSEITPSLVAKKVVGRLKRYTSKIWRKVFSERIYGYILIYLFYNNSKILWREKKRIYENDKINFLDSANRILIIFSKRHFDPLADSKHRPLSASSVANWARNIYQLCKERNKEIVYIDQHEDYQNLGKFDLIISIVCRNFIKYAKDNQQAKKVLFLVNSHPLYRLAATIKQAVYYRKKLPYSEFISPILFLKSNLMADKHILVGNQFVKNSYLKYGIPEKKIKLINGGTNWENLVPKRELYPFGKIRICYVASDMGIRKGLFRVMELWEQLNQSYNNKIELFMLGGTSSFSKEIKKFTEKYNNVKCWGWVDSTDIIYKTILQSSQIMLNLPVEEGQVGCGLEGMACGCIPVFTEETGIPIIDSMQGILIKAGSFDAGMVAQNMIKLMNNQQLMETMSLAAREYIVQNHNWESFRNNLIGSL